MNDLKVSIITPSYNQGKFIGRTIDSILNQSYKNIEYIVMDGGSTDETVRILKKYSNKIIWKSKKDNGQSEAINKGLKMASGEIVAFLNSDDTYEPEAIAKVVNFFQNNPKIKWVYGKCRIVDENDIEIRKPITLYKNFLLKKYNYRILLTENYISQPATFWRKNLHDEIGYLNEREHYTMDYEFWLRIGKKYKAGVINDYLANFRMYSSSKSGSLVNPQFKDELRIAKKFSQGDKLPIFFHKLNYYKITGIYRLMAKVKRVGSK